MKLIVGLGNPGKEYENTRHNVGFKIIDNYCKDMKFSEKLNGLYCEKRIGDEKIIFLKPLSYMNLSGNVVSKFVNFFKIEITDILVIRDDLDLKLGTFKIKCNSSSGGDNGIKSIIELLNSNSFAQLKIGISNNKMIQTKDYVLGKFTGEEKTVLDNITAYTPKIIDTFIQFGSDKTMSLHNGVHYEDIK